MTQDGRNRADRYWNSPEGFRPLLGFCEAHIGDGSERSPAVGAN